MGPSLRQPQRVMLSCLTTVHQTSLLPPRDGTRNSSSETDPMEANEIRSRLSSEDRCDHHMELPVVAIRRMTYGGSSSKRSEVGCQRRGSNPARQNLGKKPIQGAPRFSPYRPLFATCYLLFAICATRSVMSQPPIERKELLKAVLHNGVFTSADVREIRFQPG